MTSLSYTLPDYHLHSEFSTDCDSRLENIIESARNLGLDSICITDHNDLDFPDTPDHICFDLDIDAYLTTLTKLKSKLLIENEPFDLKIGLEQGVMPATCEKLNTYSQEHKGLDFIICSSHVVSGMDPYYPECWQYPDGTYKDEHALYIAYFEDMLYNVTHYNDYNVYGHIDYIFRYGPEGKNGFEKVTAENFSKKYFPKYKEILYEILKNIIEKGKGIEINTGSLYRGMDYSHPHIKILELYKDLGGEILTFGSDAHDLEHIGYDFENAKLLAKSIGFKYYSTFSELKPDNHTL